MHKIQLISLYYHICDWYDSHLYWQIQRFSPNRDSGQITDQELLTIYLYCVAYEQRFTIKDMHTHIKKYWLSWFPQLPSYQTFNNRLNRLWPAMQELVALLSERLPPDLDALPILLGDSCPVVTCMGTRKGKVAPNMTDKGYCASKKMHYFGVKLHILSSKRPSKLPVPRKVLITKASEHDLSSMRDTLESLNGVITVLDKAYCDQKLAQKMASNKSCLITPEKDTKGEAERTRQFERAYRDLMGTAVAKIRQPIESLFAWINEKTGIQSASKVRSEDGLKLHLLGKIAAALICMGAI
jgi:hypothetical protein